MNLIYKLLLSITLLLSTTYASEEVPTTEEVAKLYVATFNRAPDSTGLNYWMNDSFEGHPTLSGIAQSFFDADETKALYPDSTVSRDFIKSIYLNLFNREPDASGWDYWEDKLNGTNNYGKNPDLNIIPKNLFIIAMINGAQDNNDGLDITILNNKNEVGLYFANAGLGTDDFPTEVMSGITSNLYTVSFIINKIASSSFDENIWDVDFITGILIDNVVSDINYTCSSGNTGITTILGEFTCEAGDTVSFSIRGIFLGEADVSEVITPSTLFPNNQEAALNLAQFLQTLDNDSNLSNGITPSDELLNTIGDTPIDFTSNTFDVDVQALLPETVILVTESDAQEHLDETFAKLGVNESGEPVIVTPTNALPVANAGIDQTVTEGANVILSGTGSSDSDGTIVSYEWKEDSTILSTSSSFSKADFTDGMHTIILTVTDNEGATNSDTVLITVTQLTQNEAPVADAGVNQTVIEGTNVIFSGTGSSDNDGYIASYEWKEGSTIISTSESFTKTDFTVGTHTLILIVTDNEGATNSDTVLITVAQLTQNQAPVANAGADQTVVEGVTVTFSASGSSDSDGTIVSYEWKEGSTILSTSVSFSKSDFIIGTHTIILTVRDNEGKTGADTIVITVNGANTSEFIYETMISPITGRIWMDRNLGAKRACLSSTDIECFGDFYQWGRETDGHEKVDSVVVFQTSSTIYPNNSNFMIGNKDWTNGDAFGANRVNQWDICPEGFRIPTATEIYVENIDNIEKAFNTLQIPTAGRRSSNNGGYYDSGNELFIWSITPFNESLLFDLFPQQVDGAAMAYVNGNLMHTNMTQGFSVRCIKEGQSEPSQNQAPVANAGVDQTVVEGVNVILNASGSSDNDGTIVSYQWKEGSTILSTSTSFSKADFTAGTHTIILTVTDNEGATNSDTVLITVAQLTQNQAPVANAGVDQNIVTTSTVTLNGSASSDANFDALTYAWSITSKPAGSSAALSNATIVNPTFTADIDGSYVIRLIVDDGTVNSVADTVTITADTAPISNAGVDRIVFATSVVNLDGSGSSGAALDDLTYNWSLVSKPNGSVINLTHIFSYVYQFTADLEGIYVFNLIVNNGIVDSVVDSVTFTAIPISNTTSYNTSLTNGTVENGIFFTDPYGIGIFSFNSTSFDLSIPANILFFSANGIMGKLDYASEYDGNSFEVTMTDGSIYVGTFADNSDGSNPTILSLVP